MVRKDHFLVPQKDLPPTADNRKDYRRWVGQAGGKEREAPMVNIWRVRTTGSGLTGAPYLSTMYFDASSAQTAQHAADAVHNFWEGCKTQISSAVTMTPQADVYEIDSVTGHPTGVTGVTVTPTVGTAAGTQAPLASQGRIDWHTGVFINGREQRGRTFIPGVVTAASNGGVPSAAYLTGLATGIAALFGTAGANLVIYSRHNHLSTYVTLGKQWSNFAVLRSRRT